MSFLRPNISDILERVKGDMRSGMGLKAILRRSFTMAVAKALSGLSHELHGRASYIAQQLFPDQMDSQYLDRYGAIYALPRKTPTYARLNVKFTGEEGVTIPSGTGVTRSDGLTYTLEDDVEIQTQTTAVNEETEITTVGDLASSLNNTYFFLSAPGVDYYVWMNVNGAGSDPEIEDREGIEVPLAVGDSAAIVANKLKITLANVDGLGADVVGNVVTVTCDVAGSVTDPADVNTGFSFTVTVDGVDALTGGEGFGIIKADTAGSASNSEPNDELTLSGAVTDVDSEVIVVSVETEGEDTEEDEDYRARILQRIQQPPHGGAFHDYIQWALEVPGITRAWVLPDQMGAGSVLIWVVEDDEDNIFPDAAKVTEVEEYIRTKAPITANVFVASPSPVDMDITVRIKPYSQAVRLAITAELEDLILRDAVPHNALKNPGTQEQYDGGILISHINEAISIAVGEFDHVLVSPTTNLVATTGQMYRLGDVIFEVLE